MRTVGALLDEGAVHPGRTGRDHLRVLARAAGVPQSRVQELLTRVGLRHAAGQRAGGYSLGMRQRLGLAVMLLGDPRVLVLDEPALEEQRSEKYRHALIAVVSIGIRAGQLGGTATWLSSRLVSHA